MGRRMVEVRSRSTTRDEWFATRRWFVNILVLLPTITKPLYGAPDWKNEDQMAFDGEEQRSNIQSRRLLTRAATATTYNKDNIQTRQKGIYPDSTPPRPNTEIPFAPYPAQSRHRLALVDPAAVAANVSRHRAPRVGKSPPTSNLLVSIKCSGRGERGQSVRRGGSVSRREKSGCRPGHRQMALAIRL